MPFPAAPQTLDTDALLSDLTLEQREAVITTEGPLLILAGAGSGKTRVLTRRIAYLMSQGIDPAGILAITFTNKAAGEMRGRVESTTGRPLRDFGRLMHRSPTICTFHSLCLRILRHYGEVLGVPRNFSIYDTGDQNKLIKQVLKDLDISSTNFPPGKILGTISNAKNALTLAKDFAGVAADFYQRTVARAYMKYEQEMLRNEALDFDDLILRVVHGLRDRPDMLKELQEHFQYIHIDEYQDTNRAQYILAHVLADRHKNMCVVGDPDQSIYAWRGADLRNILDFEEDYPSAKVVKLERNYRSTAVILAVADALIANNSQRKEKKLIAHNEGGEPVTLLLCQDERDEAGEVTALLQKLKADHAWDWSDMAIFYRMNSLSRVLEESLVAEKVPYQIARGVEFYNRKEIKDTLSYLRIIANPADEVSLTRIINTPTRGIGDTSVRSLQAFGLARGMGLWEALRHADECDTITPRARGAVGKFTKMVHEWQTLAGERRSPDEKGEKGDIVLFDDPVHESSEGDAPKSTMSPFSRTGKAQAILEAVVRQSGLEAHLIKIGGEEKDELENIGSLISRAAEFDAENPEGTLAEFLHGIALVSDTDAVKDGGGSVTLMTLHAAKGLEFPVVAIIGWEEGCLPHSRARDSLHELEEERRLAFVGITRAEQRLILSKATYRTIRGMRERTIPSPFLGELPEDKIQTIDRSGIDDLLRRNTRGQESPWSGSHLSERASRATPDPFRRFAVGQRVRHPSFGIGRILDLSGGSNAKAVIDFDRTGTKTLILEYAAAKLEAV